MLACTKYNTTLGTVRAYWLATVLCIAAFMQGYDAGVAGGVLTMKSFERDYRYDIADKTRVSSLSIGLQSLGSFLASFAILPVTLKFGRKPAVMISSCVFCIGAAIETANSHSITVWYIARFIAGLGQVMCQPTTPLFLSILTCCKTKGWVQRRSTDVLC
jgi:MFS family permease